MYYGSLILRVPFLSMRIRGYRDKEERDQDAARRQAPFKFEGWKVCAELATN